MPDLVPAKIFGPMSQCRAGSDIPLICSTFGFKKTLEVVYVHLFKDGIEVDEKLQLEEQHDTVFTLTRVSTKQNGNYSCMFSKNNSLSSEIKRKGDNLIGITVIGKNLLYHFIFTTYYLLN